MGPRARAVNISILKPFRRARADPSGVRVQSDHEHIDFKFECHSSVIMSSVTGLASIYYTCMQSSNFCNSAISASSSRLEKCWEAITDSPSMRVLLLKERDGSEIPNMTTKSQLKKCCGQNMPLDHELMPLARQKMPLQKQFFWQISSSLVSWSWIFTSW